MYILVSALNKNARPLLQPELVKDLTRHMIFCVACGVVPAVPRFLIKCFARVTFSVSIFLVKMGGCVCGGVHHLGLCRNKCLKTKPDNELVQVCHVFFF